MSWQEISGYRFQSSDFHDKRLQRNGFLGFTFLARDVKARDFMARNFRTKHFRDTGFQGSNRASDRTSHNKCSMTGITILSANHNLYITGPLLHPIIIPSLIISLSNDNFQYDEFEYIKKIKPGYRVTHSGVIRGGSFLGSRIVE